MRWVFVVMVTTMYWPTSGSKLRFRTVCRAGEFMSLRHDSCIPCTSCDAFSLTLKKCTTSTDTRCLRCVDIRTQAIHTEIRECRQCRPCPEGQWVHLPCRTNRSTICQPCPPGSFNGRMSYSRHCRRCSSCRNREVVSECTSARDTVCGGCKKGLYEDVNRKMCIPCSACAEGQAPIAACKDGENGNLCSLSMNFRHDFVYVEYPGDESSSEKPVINRGKDVQHNPMQFPAAYAVIAIQIILGVACGVWLLFVCKISKRHLWSMKNPESPHDVDVKKSNRLSKQQMLLVDHGTFDHHKLKDKYLINNVLTRSLSDYKQFQDLTADLNQILSSLSVQSEKSPVPNLNIVEGKLWSQINESYWYFTSLPKYSIVISASETDVTNHNVISPRWKRLDRNIRLLIKNNSATNVARVLPSYFERKLDSSCFGRFVSNVTRDGRVMGTCTRANRPVTVHGPSCEENTPTLLPPFSSKELPQTPSLLHELPEREIRKSLATSFPDLRTPSLRDSETAPSLPEL